MTTFKARIKSQYRARFPQFRPDAWYEVEPVRPESKTRGADLYGNRIVRLKMDEEHSSMRAEYFDIRLQPEDARQPIRPPQSDSSCY
jgi:hypothetical protein